MMTESFSKPRCLTTQLQNSVSLSSTLTHTHTHTLKAESCCSTASNRDNLHAHNNSPHTEDIISWYTISCSFPARNTHILPHQASHGIFSLSDNCTAHLPFLSFPVTRREHSMHMPPHFVSFHMFTRRQNNNYTFHHSEKQPSLWSGVKKKEAVLPVRVRPQETTRLRGERNVSARRKPNQGRLPVLCHQINFTLSHLPATVMSLIHPFPPIAMATLPAPSS